MCMTTLSNNLKRLRQSVNLTQKQLATIVNVQEKSYQAWERRNIEPPIEKLIALSNFYHVSIDELVNNSTIESNEIGIEQKLMAAPENVRNAIYALLGVS